MSNSILEAAWHYSLVNISGNEIKVNNIIVAVILFIICLKLSTRLTTLIGKFLSDKFKQDKNLIYIGEKLVSFAFLTISILFSLEIANIPLSIFAFIGGALAVGIGLGAQGFISSLINTVIIIVEEPVEIGDFIEIQKITGRVTSIGNRCITVQNNNNVEILIPNTILMQNMLSKWPEINDDIVTYNVYINILKEQQSEINHNLIVKALALAAKDLDFLSVENKTEIYLTKIANLEDQFCLVLYSDRKLLKSTISTKNQINTSLLKRLKSRFTVEYSKNLL